MATKDYKKVRVNIRKWIADAEKNHALRSRSTDGARVLALKAEKWIEASKTRWSKGHKRLVDINVTWVKMADEIIRLQEDLAVAKKANDKKKFTKLTKHITQIDKATRKLEDDFHKLYAEFVNDDVTLKKVVDMLRSLPI